MDTDFTATQNRKTKIKYDVYTKYILKYFTVQHWSPCNNSDLSCPEM